MVAATAVADLAAQALKEASSSASKSKPPPALPLGWLLKESRSQPNMYYYYNQDTGESSWEPPFSLLPAFEDDGQEEEKEDNEEKFVSAEFPSMNLPLQKSIKAENTSKVDPESATSKKRPMESNSSGPAHKRAIKTEDFNTDVEKKSPTQVRVLHILKKHKDSKRPTSWRSKEITITREEAIAELNGLLEILQEEQGSPENLIATFKELASQESDCNSAKRNGDLGFFGRKKMRPEFEEAAFALQVNQLSGIVETASGAHILLRLE